MNRRHFGLALLTCVALVAAGGCRRPPPIVGNSEAIEISDQLWTAITSKRLDLLEQTSGRLRQLHDDKKIDDEAFNFLEAVIDQGRQNKWDAAVKNLQWFLKKQRA